MTITKVINLGQVMDLMAEWNKVKQAILAGRVAGFQLMVRGQDSQETIYAGGVFKHDTNLSVRANLRLSAAKMLAEDEEPLYQASTF